MPHKAASFFHLHLISDSTGETLTTVARAAAAQYANVHPVEHLYPAVRTTKQLDRVLAEIEAEPGIVLYTLLDEELVERLETRAARSACPAGRSWVRCCGYFIPILAPNRPTRSAPSTCSTPSISSGSMR